MIQKKIHGIGSELSTFSDIDIIIVGKTSLLFALELYKIICNQVSSVSIIEPYLLNDESICFQGDITSDLHNKTVFVIHSVCDTGLIHNSVCNYISSLYKNVNIKNICMINKLSNRQFDYHTDYSVLEVHQDIFFVGYGIGIDNEYRELDGIYQLTMQALVQP